jgi:hypothetical protein
MYTTTLLAGERSGNLQEVLERYVSFQKVALTFRKKLIASLIYPCVLLTLVIGLCSSSCSRSWCRSSPSSTTSSARSCRPSPSTC